MLIETNDSSKVEFKTLKYGDVFLDQYGDLCMKAHGLGDMGQLAFLSGISVRFKDGLTVPSSHEGLVTLLPQARLVY